MLNATLCSCCVTSRWSYCCVHCTLCSAKETTTHVFFYIFLENVWIYTKFSGNVYAEFNIPSTKKLSILCYWWRNSDVILTHLYYQTFST